MRFAKDLTPEHRSQLLQIYAIEREDNQNTQAVTFAIVAAALTYMVASAAFFIGHCSSSTCTHVPALVQLASPLIPFALLSSLALSVAGSLMRAKHLSKLEELLSLQVEPDIVMPSFQRDSNDIYELKPDRAIAYLRSLHRRDPEKRFFRRAMTDPNALNFFYGPLTMVAYLSMPLIALGYTIAVLFSGAWTWDKWSVLLIYLLIVMAQVIGVLLPLFHPRFQKDFTLDI